MVLSLLLWVVLSGAILRYAFVRFPALSIMANLSERSKIYPKADINTASVEDLIDIPYIGEYTADNIIRYREKHGLFRRIEELKNVKGIREENYKRFTKYLTVGR